MAGKQIQFQIPTGSYAIDTRNSFFEYTVPLTYHFTKTIGSVRTEVLNAGIPTYTDTATWNKCSTAWFING